MHLRIVALLGILYGAACGGGGGDRSPTAPTEPRPFFGTPCSEVDSGLDGTVDLVYVFTYDGDGFVTREVTSDGSTTDYTYDDDHFRLHVVQRDSSSILQYEDTYTRDPDGRVLTYADGGELGTGDASTYTYDANGRLVSSTTLDINGETTSTYMFTYTGDHLNPATGRGVVGDTATSYTYTTSANDQTLHTDADEGEDGTIDGTIDTTYDSKHRVLTEVTSSMGMFVKRKVTTWASNDFSSTFTLDMTEGDPVDYSYAATFSSNGRMAATETTSPSGEYMDFTSRETAKQTCTTPSARSATNELQVPTARRHGPRLRSVGDQLQVLDDVADAHHAGHVVARGLANLFQ